MSNRAPHEQVRSLSGRLQHLLPEPHLLTPGYTCACTFFFSFSFLTCFSDVCGCLPQVVSNLAEYGNTSAASIPLALDEAVRAGKVKPGDVVAMAGFGAGLTWAGAIVRWG